MIERANDSWHGAAHRAIATRLEFHAGVREAFEEMALAGCQQAWLCDEDFSDWPLNERAVIDSLAAWVDSRRSLLVFGHTFDDLARRHPRFVEAKAALDAATVDLAHTVVKAPFAGIVTNVPTVAKIGAYLLICSIRAYCSSVTGRPVNRSVCLTC